MEKVDIDLINRLASTKMFEYSLCIIEFISIESTKNILFCLFHILKNFATLITYRYSKYQT